MFSTRSNDGEPLLEWKISPDFGPQENFLSTSITARRSPRTAVGRMIAGFYQRSSFPEVLVSLPLLIGKAQDLSENVLKTCYEKW